MVFVFKKWNGSHLLSTCQAATTLQAPYQMKSGVHPRCRDKSNDSISYHNALNNETIFVCLKIKIS